MIKLAHVSISDKAKQSVMGLLDSGDIGQSVAIRNFEEKFAAWIGRKYAVAVCNGTMADTIALAVIKAYFPSKWEVIVPALTFAAQLNSVIYNGLDPVFCDVTEDGLMDINMAKSLVTPKTMAVFPVHLLGRYCDLMDFGVPVVEDTCEAMGTKWEGMKCGTFGALSTFSFFPSHAMTTGEGGMIVTDDERYAEMARILRNHGKSHPNKFRFGQIGFNGKMTSLQAALGYYALDDVDAVIAKRRENYLTLGGKERPGEYVSPHGVPFMAESTEDREIILDKLTQAGIECRNLFSSLPTQEMAYIQMGYDPGDFPNAEQIGKCGYYVPCHQGLSDEDLQTIKTTVEAVAGVKV